MLNPDEKFKVFEFRGTYINVVEEYEFSSHLKTKTRILHKRFMDDIWVY